MAQQCEQPVADEVHCRFVAGDEQQGDRRQEFGSVEVVARFFGRHQCADEVGLGKTIETGMIIRELMARGEARRVLVVCPAGLTRNWQQELNDCFRLDFEIVGRDFVADRVTAWERHSQVIGSIDKRSGCSQVPSGTW